VISDVPKTDVFTSWQNGLNREREVIPRSTIEKAPSAELRPNQKDEDSLPPYDVLDRILKAYIEDLRDRKRSPRSMDFELKAGSRDRIARGPHRIQAQTIRSRLK